MKLFVSAVALAAALFMSVGSVRAADKPQAEVMHWWVSAGESAAVKEIANAYTAKGGVWKDNAIAGGEVAIAAIISRITGGNPPTANQMPLGKQIDDLVEQKQLVALDEIGKKAGFWDNLPETFKKAVTYPDGHMYALPINDHGHNWTWYNKQVLADAGAKDPVTWDDLFAALDKIKAKGNAVPLAVGAQPWQLGQTFLSVVLTKEGGPFFMQVFEKLDESAVKSDKFKDAVKTFLKLRDYQDAGSSNREWNVATNMVITGKAGFYFMGDWARGEFVAAGKVAGKDFGCQILGNGDGAQYFNVAADAFIFPVNKAAGQAEAQKLLAEVMMSRDVQIAFNAKKGSVPARLDVDESKLDPCAKIGVNVLKKPNQRIPNVDFLVSPDFIGAERDLAAQAWADKSMTPDKFVAAFLKLIAAEKSAK